MRHNGAYYEISPWALSWDDENYYMIGFDSKEDKIKHFRVDKMLRIDMTSHKREGKKAFHSFDVAAYACKMFGMFSGEEETVKIRCENQLAGVIIDRFGKDVWLMEEDAKHFTVSVKVAVSRQFLSWVLALGEGAKIVGPERVVKQVREEIVRLRKQYEEQ